jgi:mono/diheme cytochrome c family protein
MSILLAASALLMAATPAAEVERGARLAQQRCASCHGMAPTGRSLNLAAPPFRDIRLRYNALSLEREMAKISVRGHFEMGPQVIGAAEAEDLAAYIESLGPAVR